jgi:hypothetical protein
VASGTHVWRRIGTPLPSHLRRSKVMGIRPGAGAGVSHGAGVWPLAVRAFLELVPPVMFRWGAEGDEGGFEIAYSRRREVVLIDPGERGVVRASGARYDERYAELRSRLARHLPCPRFELVDGGRRLRDEFVEGVHFLELDGDARLAVARRLFRRYARLARHEGEGSSSALFQSIHAAVDRADVPAALRADVSRASLLARSGGWPLVPTGVDISPDNVVIVDRQPVLIDLAKVGLWPFFLGPVRFLLGMGVGGHAGDREMLDAFRSGLLDPDLRLLCEAAGVAPGRLDETRHAFLVATSVIQAYRKATKSGDLDLRRFESVAVSTWQGIR